MSEVRTETVEYGPGSTLKAYLAIPDGAGPFPALVVIHEWWGLNDQIRQAAADLAAAGYLSLAVDLYHGKATSNPSEAPALAKSVDAGQAVQELKEAAKYLAGRKDVRKGRIGSVGWCMGGGYSLRLALSQPELAAAVIYYGRLETDPEALKKISAPVIGFFGEDDSSIPVATVREFESAMRSAGKKVTIHIYPGAGHAFANPTRTDAYRPQATKDSWNRMMSFLGSTLG